MNHQLNDGTQTLTDTSRIQTANKHAEGCPTSPVIMQLHLIVLRHYDAPVTMAQTLNGDARCWEEGGHSTCRSLLRESRTARPRWEIT